MNKKMWFVISLCIVSQAVWALTWSTFGPGVKVTAGSPPEDIWVQSYAVPSFVDWNNDGLRDLVIGEGPVGLPPYIPYTGKVRVYLNSGTAQQPYFSTFSYVLSNGVALEVPAEKNCLGTFPRVVQWDGDGRKDLLVGLGDGTVRIYFNTGADAAPVFDTWQSVEYGPIGNKTPIYAGGGRATPVPVDWNSDGKKDLIVGSLDGFLRLYINEGTDTAPDFLAESFVQENGANLTVPTARSSPEVADLNGDGKKDLLVGNTEGQLLLYLNVGSDESPAFSGYSLVEANGEVIDLPSVSSQWARSRPFVCDWNNDGYWDVLLGWGEDKGYTSIYPGQVFAGDLEPDGDVDLADFAWFAAWWLETDCGSKANCGGADIFGDGQVLLDDLLAIIDNWLLGPRW
jgi:hypothetical protein